MEQKSLSYKLADFVHSTHYEDLSEEVVAFTKLCILDWAGNAIAGQDERPIQWIKEVMLEMGGSEQASTVTGGATSVLNAAMINGAASHVVELDDIHKGSVIHAATVVIPAAVACAEWKNKSGKDLITAVALGYEICYRIGETVTPSHYYYWHNTATCGTYGAAVAVAKLLDLNVEQIVHALGSAGTQAAGLWEFIKDGAMSKQLHTAKAAYNGMLSALLAQKGFTGATEILEGERGFFNAMSESYDLSKMTKDLGNGFKILENSFKIHASCRHTHAAVDIVLDLVKSGQFEKEEVASIDVGAYKAALAIAGNHDPKTVYAAKFSIAYCVALALVKGGAGLSQFTEDNLIDSSILEVMKKVNVQVSPEIEAAYPEKWGAEVIVHLVSGNTIQGKADFPKGDPENSVSQEDLVQKFNEMTAPKNMHSQDDYVGYLLNLENEQSIKFFNDLYSIENV